MTHRLLGCEVDHRWSYLAPAPSSVAPCLHALQQGRETTAALVQRRELLVLGLGLGLSVPRLVLLMEVQLGLLLPGRALPLPLQKPTIE